MSDRQRRLGQEAGDLEPVRHPRPQLELDVDAGLVGALGGADGLVTQHLRFAGLQQQRRKAVEAREQRRDLGVGVQDGRRHVEPAQDQQVGQGQHRVRTVERGHAGTGHRAVERRRQQHGAGGEGLLGDAHPVQGDQGEVAAGGVPDQHQVAGPMAGAEQRTVDRVAVVGRGRVGVFRRQSIVRDQRPGAQLTADPRGETRMRVRKAEGERSPVQIDENALRPALGDRDPLRRDAAEIDGGARHLAGQAKVTRVERLELLPQRADVGVRRQALPRGDAQKCVERVRPQARADVDVAAVVRAALHGDLGFRKPTPCSRQASDGVPRRLGRSAPGATIRRCRGGRRRAPARSGHATISRLHSSFSRAR
ncbi:MAG: hypothetical protein IPQ15_05735 [Betaproteobacteria bacterium]|nr:hypothetical protein [Betaproteobacteria bacterium]